VVGRPKTIKKALEIEIGTKRINSKMHEINANIMIYLGFSSSSEDDSILGNRSSSEKYVIKNNDRLIKNQIGTISKRESVKNK